MPGRPKAFEDEKILEILYESDDPAMTAREIADEMGEARRTVHRRLQELAEAGTVRRKDIGAHGTIWWLSDHAAADMESQQP